MCSRDGGHGRRCCAGARDAVLAQLTCARELADADARYHVTVASLEHTLREFGLAIAIALSMPAEAPKETRP